VLLLDSQAALWVIRDDPKLGQHARRLIAAADEVHVSAATVWELTIKSTLGKISVPEKLSARLTEQGMSILGITAEHAEGLRDFPELSRHDPFDRLIVAQASLAGLDLVTADRALLALGRKFIVDATV